MRLPGATGIPKWGTRPPAATSPAGSTSRRSTIAEAPDIIRMSQPAAASSLTASATAASSFAQLRSSTGGQSRLARRRFITSEPLRLEELRVGKECVSTGSFWWSPDHAPERIGLVFVILVTYYKIYKY